MLNASVQRRLRIPGDHVGLGHVEGHVAEPLGDGADAIDHLSCDPEFRAPDPSGVTSCGSERRKDQVAAGAAEGLNLLY